MPQKFIRIISTGLLVCFSLNMTGSVFAQSVPREELIRINDAKIDKQKDYSINQQYTIYQNKDEYYYGDQARAWGEQEERMAAMIGEFTGKDKQTVLAEIHKSEYDRIAAKEEDAANKIKQAYERSISGDIQSCEQYFLKAAEDNNKIGSWSNNAANAKYCAESIKYLLLGENKDKTARQNNEEKEYTFENFKADYTEHISEKYKESLAAINAEAVKEIKRIEAEAAAYANLPGHDPDALANYRIEAPAALKEWKETALAALAAVRKTETEKVNARWEEHKKEMHQHHKEQFAQVQKLGKSLVRLYLAHQYIAAPYIWELVPMLLRLELDGETVYNEEEKETVKKVLRLAFTSKAASRAHVLNAMTGLGLISDQYDGDGTIIRNYIQSKITDNNYVHDISTGISALLAMKDYGNIRALLEHATLQETSTGPGDLFDPATYVKAIANSRGKYLGEISKYGQYGYYDSYMDNLWSDIPQILAEEGSEQSLSIIRDFGVHKCQIWFYEGKYFQRCYGMQPFLAGALISGKAGTLTYNPQVKIAGQQYFAANGKVYSISEAEAKESRRRRDASINNWNAWSKETGLSRAALLALNIINSGMGDIDARTEENLDKALYAKYNTKADHIKPQHLNDFAIVDIKRYQAKKNRQDNINYIWMPLAKIADIVITVWTIWYMGRGAVRIGTKGWRLMKLMRFGSAAERFAYMRKHIEVFRKISANKKAFVKTVAKIKTGMETTVINQRALYTSVKLPEVMKLNPSVIEHTLQFAAYDATTGLMVLDKTRAISSYTQKYGRTKNLISEVSEIDNILTTASENALFKYPNNGWMNKYLFRQSYGKTLAGEIKTGFGNSDILKGMSITDMGRTADFAYSARNLKFTAQPVSNMPAMTNFISQNSKTGNFFLNNKVIFINPEYKEITTEILRDIRSGADSKYFTRLPLKFGFENKIPMLDMKNLQNIVIYQNGDSKFWMSFITKGKNNSFRIMDPAHFKIKLSQKNIRVLTNNFNKAGGSNMTLKFITEEIASAAGKINKTKNDVFSKFNLYDAAGRQIDNFIIKASKSLEGKVSFRLNGNGSIIPFYKNGVGPGRVGGYFTVPKSSLGNFATTIKNSGISGMKATLSGGKNKVIPTILLSGVNLGAVTISLTGLIDDTYSKSEISDMGKIAIISLPALASFASPLFSRFVSRYGAGRVLGASFLIAAGTLAVPTASALYNKFTYDEYGYRPKPSPLLLAGTVTMAGLSAALSRASMNMIVHSIDKSHTLFALSTTAKAVFTPAVMSVPVLWNTFAGKTVIGPDGKAKFEPYVSSFINYPSMMLITLGSYILLRRLHLPTNIGKPSTLIAGVSALTAEQRAASRYVNSTLIASGSLFIAAESAGSSYVNKQINRELEGASSFLGFRNDWRYLAQNVAVMLPIILTRVSYRPIIKALGGADKMAAQYKFLFLNQALTIGGLAILKNSDDNLPLFMLGTGLFTFGTANTTTLIFKAGVNNIKLRGLGEMVSNKFQVSIGAAHGAGLLGGLAMSGYTGAVENRFSLEDQRMNRHIQSGLGLPMWLAAGGSLAAGLTLTKKGLPMWPVGGINSMRLINNIFSDEAPAVNPNIDMSAITRKYNMKRNGFELPPAKPSNFGESLSYPKFSDFKPSGFSPNLKLSGY